MTKFEMHYLGLLFYISLSFSMKISEIKPYIQITIIYDKEKPNFERTG